MKFWHGLELHLGRKPTRLGGDGMPPRAIVPHWLMPEVTKLLSDHGVEFTVVERVDIIADFEDDPDAASDCVVLQRRSQARLVQRLLRTIQPPDFGTGS
jgi:hypothetical protein